MRTIWLTAALLLLPGCLDAASTDTDETGQQEAQWAVVDTLEWSDSGTIVPSFQDQTGQTACGELLGETTEHVWTIEQQDLAAEARIEAMTIDLAWTEPADLDMVLLGPQGQQLGNAGEWNLQTGDFSEQIRYDGPSPAGAFTVRVTSCTGASGTYELSGSADLLERPAPQTDPAS